MIDLFEETVINLKQASRIIPSGSEGRPVHMSTLIRAITRGVKGHKLEGVKWGGRWITSREACQRWAAKLTELASQPTDDNVPKRREQIARVEQDLDYYGL